MHLGEALRRFAAVAGPASASNFLLFVNQTVTLMAIGRALDTNAQATYSVALSVYNVLALSLCLGMATAIDTLASQAFGRDPRSPEVGELLQRSVVICLAVSVPVVGVFFVSGPLLAFVFGPDLGHGAAALLRLMPPYFVFNTLNYCIMKCLQAQQLAVVPGAASVASVLPCLLGNMYLTPRFGLPGAVMATTAGVAMQFVVNVAGGRWHPQSVLPLCRWPLPMAELLAPAAVKDFLRVGVAATFAICSEIWAFELLLFVTAAFGEVAVDSFNIALNVIVLLFSIPNGIGVALGVLTGNALGADKPHEAKYLGRVGCGLSAMVGAVNVLLLGAFGTAAFQWYSQDPAVLASLHAVKPLMMLIHTFDCVQTAMQGIFRGADRQEEAARVIVASLWLVGFCGAVFLSRGPPHLGLTGVLGGLLLGIMAEVPLLLWRVRKFDWAAIAAHASHHEGAIPPPAGPLPESPRHPSCTEELPPPC